MPLPRTRTAIALSVTVITALTTASTGTAWSDTSAPAPVLHDPKVEEEAPATYGPWSAWTQDTTDAPYQGDLFIQRGGQPKRKVNAPGTHSSGGGILDRAVIYDQQRGKARPRLFSYDLATGRRTPLPRAVNQAKIGNKSITILGDVHASGPWVMYLGQTPVANDYPRHHVVLYNRTTRKVRVIASIIYDYYNLVPGQINGDWITWTSTEIYSNQGSDVTRYNIRTGRATSFEVAYDEDTNTENTSRDAAVTSDGTLYYWLRTSSNDSSDDHNTLMRRPIGEPATALTTLPGWSGPHDTFVKDRPDGSTAVFYSYDDDVYRVIDNP